MDRDKRSSSLGRSSSANRTQTMASGSDDTIKVAVRVRPLVTSEIERACRVVLEKNGTQVCVNSKDRFTYNYVFDKEETQEMVYENAIRPIVRNLFCGLNVTILAYGQTGSGKTHTMGTNFTGTATDEEGAGLIPRAIGQIFEQIDNTSCDYEFEVSCSFIELYQERLYDLLSSAPRDESIVDIREDSLRGVFIANLTEIAVESSGEAIECLAKGSSGRAVGATAMNAASSRSHAIFTLNVRMTCRANPEQATSAKFHLVDLAGSERSNKTKATGQRFKEGVKINQGLLALGNVISALGSSQRSGCHITYRDSKLTRLLQDSLGGNSLTLMIACVSPADYNIDETLSTLRYADRAKQIRNKPIVNQDPKMAEINRLNGIISKLRLELLERDNPEQPMTMNGAKAALMRRGSSQDDSFSGDSGAYVSASPKRAKFRRLSGVPSCEEMCELRVENEKLKKEHVEMRETLDQNLLNLSRLNLSYYTIDYRLEKQTEQLKMIKQQADELCADLESTSKADMVGLVTLLHEKIDETCQLKTETVRLNDTYVPDVDPSDNGEDPNTWSEYQKQQIKYNNQLMDIQQQIVFKACVNERVKENQMRMAELSKFDEIIAVDYAGRLKTMEAELMEARREADDMKRSASKSDRTTAKLAEDRRKRVMQLEASLKELQKDFDKQKRVLRQQEAYKDQLVRQERDLAHMKKVRVELIRKVKDTTDQVNAEKSKSARERVKQEAQMRKKTATLAAANIKAERDGAVMRRKVESYIAANKRLKMALEKHTQVQSQRKQSGSSAQKESQIQTWIDQEIEIIYSVVDAKHSLQQLIDDRTSLNRRLIQLRATEEEVDQVLIGQIEEEIEMRNVQISDIQEKIRSSDVDEKVKQIVDGLNSMVESRCAMRQLLASLTDLRVEFNIAESNLQDVKSDRETMVEKNQLERMTNKATMRELRNECLELQARICQIEKSYEEKVALLLGGGVGSEIESNDAENIQQRIQSELIEQLQKKLETCESQLHVLHTRKSIRKTRHQNENDELFSDEQESISDGQELSDDTDRDPDWHKTPAAKEKRNRRQPLREKNIDESVSNISGPRRTCNCKAFCKTKLCSCRKMGAACDAECGCDRSRCENMTDSSMAASDLDSTFSVVENHENIHKTPKKELANTTVSKIVTTTPYPYEHKKKKPLLDF